MVRKLMAYKSLSFESIGLITIILSTLFIVGVSQGVMYSTCKNYGFITERITKYSILNGCFVKTPSGWIPQEEMTKGH